MDKEIIKVMQFMYNINKRLIISDKVHQDFYGMEKNKSLSLVPKFHFYCY